EGVLGGRERGVGRDRVEPLAQAGVARNDRRELRDELRRLPPLVLAIDRSLGRIGERQGRGGCPEHLHRRRVARVTVDDRGGGRRQLTRRQLLAEGGRRLARRQLGLEQQVRHVLVRRVVGQVGDVVTAIHQNAALRVDGAD